MRGSWKTITASAILAGGALVGGQQQPSTLSAREDAYRANNRGVALLEQFNYVAAADQFRAALRIEPSLQLASVNLAIALYYVPDLPTAEKQAIEAARLAPGALEPIFVQGLIARATNRDADALRFFERVHTADPADIASAVNIAQIDIENRRYDDAIRVLRPAVNDEPFNITATYNLGLALTRAGQRDEGQRLLEKSQSLRGTGYATTFGSGYLEQGHYAEALASTGAEADLVDPATPAATLTAQAIGQAGTRERLQAPFGRTYASADLTDAGIRELAAALGGGLALADLDGDGDLDVCVADATGVRVFRNDSGRLSDVTAASGIVNRSDAGVALGCVAGDYDNDMRPDLFVMRYGRSSLYRNEGNGHFVDVTASVGLPPFPFLPGAAAFVDVDHDGDLDLVIAGLADINASRATGSGSLVFPRDFAPAPMQLLRNDGNGHFTETTNDARLETHGHAIAIVPTDFDNRRDIDLLIVNRDSAPALFKNMRDGTFRDVAADVGLGNVWQRGSDVTAVAAGDVNKDDFTDFYFGRESSVGVFAMSNGRGRFTLANGPGVATTTVASQLVDYDSDGLLDLLSWTPAGPSLFRSLGRTWSDTTSAAIRARESMPIASSRAIAVGDIDGDGGSDIVTLDARGDVSVWRSGGVTNRRAVAVRPKARVSNRSAFGTKVQLRAGSLSQRVETSSASPSIAPADVLFGLGPRTAADVVRVLWPSGILQAETIASPLPRAITVEELDRKPSSCPFLYTWNGERFEFVTDFMGGGEMGYWEGPGEHNTPDPVEYVRIGDDQLRPRDGRYDIRVTNELEETLYVDQLTLIAVDHDPNVEIFPNEGMTDPPKPYHLYAIRDLRVPRATDDHGHDVTDRIARIDRRYPDDFTLKSIRGYAEPHALAFEIDPEQAHPALVLTAWTDYAFSSDNVAAHQAGWTLTSPALQVKDSAGAWRTAIADIGIPVGRPQTMVVDLGAVLRAGEHEVRIVTNMRIYWDRALVGTIADRPALTTHTLAPRTATLRERGFSAEVRPDGRDPVVYDYQRVSTESPWKVMTGRYTRPGDVLSLVTKSDDLFVIGKPGDEIALTFDAPPLASGKRRTFLLRGDGFSKEMDINSASPDFVEPLPFHRMSAYPYPPSEHYPTSDRYERYRRRFNTRIVPRN